MTEAKHVFCQQCGTELHQAFRVCPTCGSRGFASTPPMSPSMGSGASKAQGGWVPAGASTGVGSASVALPGPGGVGFADAIRLGFGKYTTFSGRSCRSEFWYWSLYYLLLAGVGLIAGVATDAVAPIYGIIWIVHFLPSLAISVRRLHDGNRVGWWYLLTFIPLVGAIAGIVLLVWFCQRGTVGSNRFGPDPLS